MKCPKCEAIWENNDLTNCPYCLALIKNDETQNNTEIDIEKRKENQDILLYIIEKYTIKIYEEINRLKGVISDLYPKDEFRENIIKVISTSITVDMYLYEYTPDNFYEFYHATIYKILDLTQMSKEEIIDVVNLLLYGINIDSNNYIFDENYIHESDIAGSVLKSVLSKSNETEDFADTIIDFINNS